MNDAKSSATSLSPGTMLRARYRIDKVLGQGGFGITYAAFDTKNQQKVAVKELFPSRFVSRSGNHCTVIVNKDETDTFQQMLSSFEKEANVLIQLQHLEGVVRLMHVFSENETMYYVMELLEGEDLMHKLHREGPMRWEQLAAILKPVMHALEQIHALGLIHRDISPDNIFLTKNGARLIDFGSVRNYQGKGAMTTMVKQNFAPIEQFHTNGNQGPWTDIYALSVTAYYALAGQLPPRAPDRQFNDTILPLGSHCPDLPKYICAAIHHGMGVQPEHRFQTLQQFSHALKLGDYAKPPVQQGSRLMCLKGYFAGKSWNLKPGAVLRIGRNKDCEVCYPAGYPGVSRVHCEVMLARDGRIYVRDCNSRYGTRLVTAEKNVVLDRNVWYYADGAHILFSPQEDYVLMR